MFNDAKMLFIQLSIIKKCLCLNTYKFRKNISLYPFFQLLGISKPIRFYNTKQWTAQIYGKLAKHVITRKRIF